MNHTRHSEEAFETVIEAHLLGNGYVPVAKESFDRERAIFPETVLAFIRLTQPKAWAKLESLHGDMTGEQILGDLCKWMDTHGALATLRHGFKCYGRTLHAAYFKAAHELNPELEARYAANRLGLTRQLHFSRRSEQSLDVTLSLNGIPVATVELKNPLTCQRIEDACRQYRQDRDPRDPIFEFKRRTLVHFAVDTESVFMTTRLAGTATHFLPFNRGCDGAAGNPRDPEGRTYRTAYLWEEVLQRDSLLDLLARFMHLQIDEKRDDQGRKVTAESMIFPRYHQLEAVRMLVDAAGREGVGHNYLVEHSAGSGKSNTIGWLTHRLAGIQAVQTLSRLNRRHPLKEDTFVLDFVNDREEIREAFKTYYEGAEMGEEVDPARMYAIQGELDASGIYLDEEVERFSAVYFKPKRRQSVLDHQTMNAALDPVVSRFTVRQTDDEEAAEHWRGQAHAFLNLYGFLSQVIPVPGLRP